MSVVRQIGRTTRAIAHACSGAIYVAPGGHMGQWYTQTLAKALNRHDIQVIRQDSLSHDKLRGQRDREIVIDHACQLTDEQNSLLLEFERACRFQVTRCN